MVSPVPARVLSLRSKLSNAPFSGLVASRTVGRTENSKLRFVTASATRSPMERWWRPSRSSLIDQELYTGST